MKTRKPNAAKEPERSCVACRGKAPAQSLFRFVLDPDGNAALDFSATLPGRGAYVHPSRACFDMVERKALFRRAFKTSGVRFDADFWWKRAAEKSVERVLELLYLAKKSGRLVAGGDKAKAFLGEWGKGLLILSEDAAPRTVAQFERLAETCGARHVRGPDSARIGHALARPSVVVLAVADGPLAEKLLWECSRFERIRNDEN